MRLPQITIFAVLILGQWSYGEATGEREFKADGSGIVSLATAPDYVAELAEHIGRTEMKRWLLSEEKNVRWLVVSLRIIEDDLIQIELSDGNGAEKILFDRNHDGEWSIIRRSPLGDWKPSEEREGDRLTKLEFPTNKKQNKSEMATPRKPSD